MNDATRVQQQARDPATLRLPIELDYPLPGIAGRTAIGAALLALSAALLLAGSFWVIIGSMVGLLGVLVAASNLRALVDRGWRKISLSEDGVEIRYGFSRRYYRFLSYSEYRIARLGLRRFLTALPLEVEQAVGERAGRVGTTLYDRPAFITPMPVFGAGAPGTLLEWQALLNELRRAAFVSAGLASKLDEGSRHAKAEDRRRAQEWRVRERAGVKPSRVSRRGYVRGRVVLAVAFLILLLAPMGLALFARHVGIAVCWPSNGSSCVGVAPAILQALSIGGPVLGIFMFVAGGAWLAVRRAHDLDVDLSYWHAIAATVSRRGTLQHRLSVEEGTPGPNRFGTVPPN